MYDQDKRFTPAMITQAVGAALFILLFFLPIFAIDYWIDTYTISCATFFPNVNDVAGYGTSSLYYLLLLLYLIPAFAALTIIFFLTRNRKTTNAMFIATCISALVNMLLFIVYATADSYDPGASLEAMFNQLTAVYWLILVLAVAGLIFAIATRQPRASMPAPAGYGYGQPQPGYGYGQPGPIGSRRYGLMAIQGEYAGNTIPIPPEGLLIGRDASMVNLVLTGSDISRRHCRISLSQGGAGLTVTDFSSVGTYIDNIKMAGNAPQSVRAGQRLYLGSKSQVFEVREI